MLHSSEDQGVVYVETSSLDGETNLKRKQALSETQEALPSLAALCQWKVSRAVFLVFFGFV